MTKRKAHRKDANKALDAMPLKPPSSIRSEERKERMRILKHTIDQFEMEGDVLKEYAQINMTKWLSEKPTEPQPLVVQVVQEDMLVTVQHCSRKYGAIFKHGK